MLAQALDVGDQVPGGVVGQFRMRRGFATTALVEQHDAVLLRVEETAATRASAAAGAAMEEDPRLSLGVAAFPEEEGMQRGHLEHAAVERLDRGVEVGGVLGHGGRVFDVGEMTRLMGSPAG